MASLRTKSKTAKKKAPVNPTILAWDDDPADKHPSVRPAPNPSAKSLGYRFPKPTPPPAQYPLDSASFRYWVAVDALRRGADYWAPLIPTGKWHPGRVLPVLLDEGEDLNAFYDRQALNFFHGPLGNRTVFSCESPDVLCHEMGHAILDAVKPGLWDAASHEVAAFHESFGDMSAILSGLQLQSLRLTVLNETSGHLFRSSRLSRLAEQLGAAIRAQHPDAVDRDCLRDAVNSFHYRDPMTLPPSAPATQLSSEPHSFSRVFTAAFLEGLAGLLGTTAKHPKTPTEHELLAVSKEMGAILIAGIRRAPIVANFYSQAAAGMVRAAHDVGSSHAAVLNAAFVRRGILSVQSAAMIGNGTSSARAAARSMVEVAEAEVPLTPITLDGAPYGLGDAPLFVFSASHPRSVSVTSVAPGGGQAAPASSDVAAKSFAEDLFRRGRVDVGRRNGRVAGFADTHSLKSHKLVAENGGVALRRLLFDCGYRCR